MRRVGKNIRPYLEKARDSALLAVEIYNKPAVRFRSSGYVSLMVIAWTSLFHAIFLTKRTRPYYRKQSGRFDIIDGDYRHWDLKECAKQFWGSDTQNAVRKNLELFIPLRNMVEHRYLPALDADIFGECQALLLNFDALIGSEFGEKYRLREALSFSLQLFPSGESISSAIKTNKHLKEIKRFIDSYRSTISADVSNTGQFSFKAFLIQVVNHQSQDATPIQFIQYDKLNDEQKAEVGRIPALIKLKQVSVLNDDLLKAGTVVQKVHAALGNVMTERHGKQVQKFNLDTHRRCWQRYEVRPAGTSDKPEFTDQRYCIYDRAHRDYLYTNEWVQFLIRKMGDDAEYQSLYS